MANNYGVLDKDGNPVTKASLDIGGVQYDKAVLYDTSGNPLVFNPNGSAADAASAPVTQSTEDKARIGATNETAPSTDTATAGLNGRLQRLAQQNSNAETKLFEVTLSLDTSAYSSGDLLADAQQCDGALAKADGTGVLQSIMIIDEDDQKAAFTIYLTNVSTSWGTENSAPTISDTVARGILAIIDVATTDYKDLGGVSVANIKGIGAVLKSVSGNDDLYVAVVNGSGAPTYTGSGVKLRLGILQG